MRTRSEQYRRLLAEPEHVKETRAVIAGTEYGQDRIFSCDISCTLFPDAVVGSCVSHELDLTVEPRGEIPRMARIEVFGRLTAGGEVSEWMPLGVFFVDTREFDEASGLLDLHGFDAMLKAEARWWDPSEDAGEWPMPQREAAARIAARMGTAVDPRSAIDPGLTAEYPNDLTMREVLGYIAAGNGGNWIMSGDGRLLLSPLGGIPAETRGLVTENGEMIVFGEVRVVV